MRAAVERRAEPVRRARTRSPAVGTVAPLRARLRCGLLLLLPPPVKAVVFANCRDRSAGSERWQLGDRACTR